MRRAVRNRAAGVAALPDVAEKAPARELATAVFSPAARRVAAPSRPPSPSPVRDAAVGEVFDVRAVKVVEVRNIRARGAKHSGGRPASRRGRGEAGPPFTPPPPPLPPLLSLLPRKSLQKRGREEKRRRSQQHVAHRSQSPSWPSPSRIIDNLLAARTSRLTSPCDKSSVPASRGVCVSDCQKTQAAACGFACKNVRPPLSGTLPI
jgi:hypothetical protein